MSTLFTKFALNGLSETLQAVNYSNNFATNKSLSVAVGRVFGTVTTVNTPSRDAFNDPRVGGYSGIGSIFFKKYSTSKDEENTRRDSLFASCEVASPLFPHITYYPLEGELVYILFLPSAGSQVNNSVGTYYYLSPINLWSNGSVNSQSPNPGAPLGKTFIENPNIKNLLSFEGDFILQGRKGNSIRLGSSVKKLPQFNEWSDRGKDGDPITIIYNGVEEIDISDYNIEKINIPKISALYLTTSQRIPLEASSAAESETILISTPRKVRVDKYDDGSQSILTADRVILNAKSDKVLLFADKSIELSTKNIISLNSDTGIHLNVRLPRLKRKNKNKLTPSIFLGTKSNGELPDEPLVLGGKLEDFLSDLIKQLSTFASRLMPSAAPQEGSPIMELQSASEDLVDALADLEKKIEEINSKSNFTV